MRQNYTNTRTFTPPSVHDNRFSLLFIFLLTFLFSKNTFSQGVGIGTTDPDPSAALHIYGNFKKGLLIPSALLLSKSDKTSVPNPATALLVYNTNAAMYAGTGFYYNSGTTASPNWRSLNQWSLPYEGTGAEDQLLNFENYSNNANSATLRVHNVQGYALKTSGKIQIAGSAQSPGAGKVLTSDASGNATWEGAVAFRASGVKGNGGQKIAGQVETQIPFAGKDYDLGNNYNDFNGNPKNSFVAPKNGIYHFDAMLTRLTNLGAKVDFALVVKRGGNSTKISEASSELLSTDVYLLEGDQVYISVYSSTSDYYEYYTQERANFFSGHLLIKL
ncbi:C1q-like domain-containing protein [Dyadobacter luticola]|uniref:C1q domain-containing protein n=1 Tax=Dyadobacter luticola TaxID=1979387 RepID=A0A5R9L1J2_9BACT|nr:hypothetical protein [Dyadobacter luticola]TLV02215.1 hypothetical protein FEN17_00815 [Dyadobacter luticola]